MSRSKTEETVVTNENIPEVKEEISVEKIEVPIEKGVSGKAVKTDLAEEEVSLMAKTSTPSKMGVEIFLQKCPQSPDIESVMRKKYKMSRMTYDEWLIELDKLLNKKVIS